MNKSRFDYLYNKLNINSIVGTSNITRFSDEKILGLNYLFEIIDLYKIYGISKWYVNEEKKVVYLDNYNSFSKLIKKAIMGLKEQEKKDGQWRYRIW